MQKTLTTINVPDQPEAVFSGVLKMSSSSGTDLSRPCTGLSGPGGDYTYWIIQSKKYPKTKCLRLLTANSRNQRLK